jgi:hypothetical protein
MRGKLSSAVLLSVAAVASGSASAWDHPGNGKVSGYVCAMEVTSGDGHFAVEFAATAACTATTPILQICSATAGWGSTWGLVQAGTWQSTSSPQTLTTTTDGVRAMLATLMAAKLAQLQVSIYPVNVSGQCVIGAVDIN